MLMTASVWAYASRALSQADGSGKEATNHSWKTEGYLCVSSVSPGASRDLFHSLAQDILLKDLASITGISPGLVHIRLDLCRLREQGQ